MKDIIFTVQHNKPIGKNVFELKLFSNEQLPPITAGQFLNIESPLASRILRRPFCIHKWGSNYVTIAIEKKGSGTAALESVRGGQQLRAILPLGNGFSLKEEWKRVAILGGSIGCAPLLGISKAFPDKEYFSFLGFKSKEHVLFEEDFAKISQLTLCTYDGSYGKKGYQAAMLSEQLSAVSPDVMLVCGSKSLVRSVKELSEKTGIPAFVSTEQRMACGVGACLGCTCKVTDKEGVVRNKRVCMDGPVFDLKDVVLS